MVEFFINGHVTGSSGSLPQGITANAADVMWGSPNTSYFNKTFPSSSYSNASYDFIIDSTFVIEQTDTMAIDSSGLYIFETPDNISMIEGDNVLLQDVNLIVKNGTELIINGNLDILGATVTVEPDAVFRVYGEVSDQSLILGAGIVEIGFFAGHNNYCLAEMRMYDYGLKSGANGGKLLGAGGGGFFLFYVPKKNQKIFKKKMKKYKLVNFNFCDIDKKNFNLA